jgi:hypothetical protein
MHNPDDDKPKASGSVQAASTSAPAKALLYRASTCSTRTRPASCAPTFVPVTTGITGATDIEVLSGLTEGQEIVTGPFKTLRALKSGSLVKRDTEKPAVPASSSSHRNRFHSIFHATAALALRSSLKVLTPGNPEQKLQPPGKG